MEPKFKRLKYACYTSYLTMSVVGNLSPILFLPFRSLYGISYSLLGLLVLVNFFTQLTVDLIFSFFSHKFNISKIVKCMPVIAVAGLGIYALWPLLFPRTAYAGLVLGTVVFSSSCGLAEVLLSPVIAAVPSKDPDREMSKLHSVYAWGVVVFITASTLFLLKFGAEKWQWLALVFSSIPLCSAILFSRAEIPCIETPQRASGALLLLKDKEIWPFIFGIFLGGSAECTMAQWSSGYLEQALGIPKVWGDIFGVSLFALMLGVGRSLYSKIGKNIGRVLFLGGLGATVCYLIAALSNHPVFGLIACAFTGFCVSMLWPGSLIIASDRFPAGGVFIYAMMAAGGDLGASVGPQLVGIITDIAMENPHAVSIAQSLGFSSEQLGMKLGMLVGMLFPLISVPVYAVLWKNRKKRS